MDSSYLDSSIPGSRLRLPQKVSLPTGGLTEMSASENNARSAMPPPALANGYNTLKHRPAGLQESQSKRQTLAEKAGQPRSKQPALSTIRQVNSNVTNLARAGPKNVGSSFSSTHGPASKGLRGPGFSSSHNGAGGSRPGLPRAQTAMGHNRSQSQHNSRPASAFGHARSLSQSVQGQHPAAEPVKDGMTPFLTSANPPRTISTYNVQRETFVTRRRYRVQSNASSTTRASTATLEESERSVSDPFSNTTSRRASSLCEQFLELDLSLQQEEQDENTPIDEDRMLMPPPPPTRKLTGKSSIPRLSPVTKLQASSSSEPNPTMRRSPAPNLHFKTPKPKKQRMIPTSPCKTPTPIFLNKESLTPMPAWGEAGVNKRLEGIDEMFKFMKNQMEGTTFEQKSMKEIVELQRDQMAQLQLTCKNLSLESESLRSQLADERENMSTLMSGQIEERRSHEIEMDDLERNHRHEIEDVRDQHRKEVERLRREASDDDDTLRRQHREDIDELLRKHRMQIDELEKRLKAELDEEKVRRLREVSEISVQRDEAISRIATGIGEKAREADIVREDLRQRSADLEREKMLRSNLETKLSEATANFLSLEGSNSAMRAKIEFLESDNQQQSQQFADLHRRMQDAIDLAAVVNDKLRAEESLRRKLHNQVQELKGNIRVFCRVRPPLGEEEDVAKIGFPDDKEESKEIAVRGPETKSALGNVTAANHAFAFDRVFGPGSANADVFDEISQLVQSALDGYNVCIFCYGQTGSGKTFTMSSPDGMIPRAVRQIYESATALEEKGWKYTMQGSFVEVYNEEINDLLGRAEDLDKKKHEIRHDMKKSKTTITDVETIELDSPDRVQEVLKTADRNRTVAATKANMRSSRSHSVFILTLIGENSITGEKCEGTLNLVDLAGSERLSHSQAEGQRLKETQNINKSLSCLGDVIGALGSSKGENGHIPYRNSKLTYLLQFSLGGNSKTLMFVMVSPLQAHLSETLTSLKFATKVHNTHIGTAKRQSKVTSGH